jgi:hypothetical protein
VFRSAGPGVGGAGGSQTSVGRASAVSVSSSTGRKVPLVRWVSAGSWLAACWSRLRSTSTTAPCDVSLSPPASDITTTLVVPPGEATITSRSSTQWLPSGSAPVVMWSSRTFTSVTVPVRPLTTMFEGYGLIGPKALPPTIAAVLQNDLESENEVPVLSWNTPATRAAATRILRAFGPSILNGNCAGVFTTPPSSVPRHWSTFPGA